VRYAKRLTHPTTGLASFGPDIGWSQELFIPSCGGTFDENVGGALRAATSVTNPTAAHVDGLPLSGTFSREQ
jgi:hypothetical protein